MGWCPPCGAPWGPRTARPGIAGCAAWFPPPKVEDTRFCPFGCVPPVGHAVPLCLPDLSCSIFCSYGAPRACVWQFPATASIEVEPANAGTHSVWRRVPRNFFFFSGGGLIFLARPHGQGFAVDVCSTRPHLPLRSISGLTLPLPVVVVALHALRRGQGPWVPHTRSAPSARSLVFLFLLFFCSCLFCSCRTAPPQGPVRRSPLARAALTTNKYEGVLTLYDGFQ